MLSVFSNNNLETVKLLHQNKNNGFKSRKFWWGMFLLHFIRFLLSFSFWVLFWECIFLGQCCQHFLGWFSQIWQPCWFLKLVNKTGTNDNVTKVFHHFVTNFHFSFCSHFANFFQQFYFLLKPQNWYISKIWL